MHRPAPGWSDAVLDDVASGCDMTREEAAAALDELMRAGLVVRRPDGTLFLPLARREALH